VAGGGGGGLTAVADETCGKYSLWTEADSGFLPVKYPPGVSGSAEEADRVGFAGVTAFRQHGIW
jgi:hypothetical protein